MLGVLVLSVVMLNVVAPIKMLIPLFQISNPTFQWREIQKGTALLALLFGTALWRCSLALLFGTALLALLFGTALW